nr:MAG TPA: hypothetical protein [Caudoviricetes sp.]
MWCSSHCFLAFLTCVGSPDMLDSRYKKETTGTVRRNWQKGQKMSTITTYQLETIINIAREDFYTFNKAFKRVIGADFTHYCDIYGPDYTFSWNLRHALNRDDAEYLIGCTGYDENQDYIPCEDDYEWLMANC